MADHAVDGSNRSNTKDKDGDAVFRTPSELSQAEYDDLLDQIRSSSGDNDDDEVSLNELHDELMEAARYNDVDVVRAILCIHSTVMVYRQRPPQDGGNTALHMAAANGHVEIIELLLLAAARGPDNSSENTPSLRWHLIPNAAGNTALHWAAANGQTDVVKRTGRGRIAQEQCRSVDSYRSL
jgi:ankyrin repeat protein